MVVVHHDATVPDGAPGGGPTGIALAALDFAALHAHRLRDGHLIPSLDAVLDLVGAHATVLIEVKASGIEDALVSCLERHPRARVAVHAFDHRIPVAVRARRPGTTIGLLSASYPLDLGAVLRPASPEALWQQCGLIDADLVREAHASGAAVIAWTENDPSHAKYLLSLGVDGFCTDVPDVLRRVLGS